MPAGWMSSARMTGSNLRREGRFRSWAGLAALIVALLIATAGGERVSRPVFDLWQQMMPRPGTPRTVEIVWIDEASIRTLGPWPWPRFIMARLVAKLAEDQPRLIGLDMLFPEPDRQDPAAFVALYPELDAATADRLRALPSMDALFAGEVGRAPVVLGRAGLDAKPVTPPALAVEARFSRPLPPSVRGWGQVLPNIAAIDDVGLGHGLLNGDADSDGIVRRVPLAGRVAGTDTPGFALELARIASGEDIVGVEGKGATLNGVGLGKTLLPVRPDGTMDVRFSRPEAAPPISALDILYDLPPSQRVRGRIVIVGISGAGTADVVSTPIAAKAYGASVHADAVEAILAGKTLSRPRWAAAVEFALAGGLTLAALLLLPRARGRSAMFGIVAATAAMIAASAAAFRFGLLVSPVPPLAISGAAAMTLFVLLFARARADLQQQRLAAARTDGELAAARAIQTGMLPPRAGLSRVGAPGDVDALIEPARTIGGDFYDILRLDEHRLCLLVGDVTGKGVGAALFMALSKALAKSILLREGAQPAGAIMQLNNEIARDNPEDMFVTMMVAVIDTRDGATSLLCAGHENPWLVRADGTVRQLSPEGGPPLGIVADFPYAAEPLTLATGDALVIVSDGITEAQSADGGFFGPERIAAILGGLAPAAPASAASDALLREVRLFEGGAEATDDLTVLVYRYLT